MITLDEISSFQRDFSKAWQDFETVVLPQVEQRYAADAGLGEAATGQGIELALEAITRRYLIDPLLAALGWKVTAIETLMVEAPVQRLGQHRRFMDYHGYEVETGEPLLLVEAKRLSANPPRPRLRRGAQPPNMTQPQLIAEAIKYKKIPADSRRERDRIELLGDWDQWIDDLSGYVKGLHEQRKDVPCRVLITNGDWIIIFEDVEDAFISGSRPSVEKIRIFENHDDIIKNAPEIVEKLAYSQLSKHIPPQHPSELNKFLNDIEEITCSHALQIYYDPIAATGHHARPKISVALVIMVLSSGGVWVICEKKHYDKHFFELPYEKEKLYEVCRDIESQATLFLQEVRDVINKPVRLLSSTEYEKGSADKVLNINLLVTGQLPSLFLLNEVYNACPYHNWPKCQEEGNAVGNQPLFSPSLNPRAYFPSGNPFHCAHIKVHNLRKIRCRVQGFDTFLCCRRCTFFELCWHDEESQLPCKNKY